MTPEIDILDARAARLAAQIEALADALHAGVVPSTSEALESLGILRDDVLRYAEAQGAGACNDLGTLRAITERAIELANALSRIVPVDAETAAEFNATRARILDRDHLTLEHVEAVAALIELIAGATTLPSAEYDLRETQVDEAFGRKIRQAAARGLLRLPESVPEVGLRLGSQERHDLGLERTDLSR